jgi:hypothetical protein
MARAQLRLQVHKEVRTNVAQQSVLQAVRRRRGPAMSGTAAPVGSWAICAQTAAVPSLRDQTGCALTA